MQKRNTLLLAILFSFVASFGLVAQDDNNDRDDRWRDNDNPQTLFGDENSNIDFFLGYSLDFRDIGGELARSRTWQAGFEVGRNFTVGAYTSKLKTENFESFTGFGDELEAELQQGGLLLGIHTNRNNVIHVGLASQIGWGRLHWEDPNGNKLIRDNIIAIMPRVEAELNLLRGLRLHSFAGYQVITGAEEPADNSLDSFSAGLGLRLSIF